MIMLSNYEKIKIIGKGTFGFVSTYRRLSDSKVVVIKQISIHQITESEKDYTNNEVKVLSILDHPHIIDYYDSFIEDGILSIVMEYAIGGTLGSFLRSQNNVPLKEDEMFSLFSQMVLGLEHIHSSKIVHRDLTTENVFLTANCGMIKIGDFGISKLLASKTKANTIVGTPCYMSPELCEGRPYDYKSDIWALGCILYEMLTLKRAFEAPVLVCFYVQGCTYTWTLPNLVMKIMSGSFQPITEYYYDAEIYKLMNSMMHLQHNLRPSITNIRVHPVILKPLYSLFVNIGQL